ncbi:MAG TPA: hypothetical protein VMP11_00015 [Verrucomicrobiae bacterium]|nr:hypothetical protein [Verrucomicrobiae bacterium]
MSRAGMGTALLAEAEADVKRLGAKGLAAWGNTFPDWMPVAWLLKQGYAEVERRGTRVLVWKSFGPDTKPPNWRVPRKTPIHVAGKVTVTELFSPWCGDACDFYERVAERVRSRQDRIRFTQIDTSDPATLEEWGFNNTVFVNDCQITGGFDQFEEVLVEELRRAGIV